MTTARQISARAITAATRTLCVAFTAIREQERTDGVDNTAEVFRLGVLLGTLVAANPATVGDIVSDLNGTGATDEDYAAL
jgi:hypothetical protein